MAGVRSRMATKWGFDLDLWAAVEAGEDEATKYFETWNRKVIENVPKERLLVYNVKEGWEPLARFLNVTPPANKPFPKINDADTVVLVVQGGYWLLLGIPFVCLLLCTCKVRRRLLERSLVKCAAILKNASPSNAKNKMKGFNKLDDKNCNSIP